MQYLECTAGNHLEGVDHCNCLDIAALTGTLRDFDMKAVLSENIFDKWSKADNSSCILHGRNIIHERDNDTFSTENVKVHLHLVLDSFKRLLGAEKRGLDGKLEEMGASRVTLSNSSAGRCNSGTSIVTHRTGVFILKTKEGYERRVVETERIINNAVTCAIESVFDIN